MPLESFDSLSPTQTSSTVKNPEHKKNPDDLEQALIGDVQWNIPLISCTAQV